MPIWTIWAALTFSIVVYGVIGLMITREPVEPENAGEAVKAVLIPLGVVLLGMSFFLRFVLIGRRPKAPFEQKLAAQIIIFAMTESLAVFALVLYLLGGLNQTEFLTMLGISFVGMLTHGPTWLNARHHPLDSEA